MRHRNKTIEHIVLGLVMFLLAMLGVALCYISAMI